MKIVIDGRMLYWTGVGRYTLALLEELERLDQDNDYTVLVRRADWGKWEPRSDNFRKLECNIKPYTVAEQVILPRVLRALGPDLVHLVTPNAAILYGGRRVVTVHDLTLLDYDTAGGSGLGKVLRGLKRIPFRLIFGWQVRRASRLVAPTKYVKDQLVKRFRIDTDRVDVTYEAADSVHLEAAREEAVMGVGADDEFVMYLGNYFPYKNVGVLIDGFARVAAERPELKLVLAGRQDAFRDALEANVRQMGLGSRVFFAGYVPDGQIKWLYRHARLFVYPSLSEGFGLQALEAMTQGLPVLAAKASCLPELCGEAAVYFDPHDAKDLAEKVGDLLANPKLRERMKQAGLKRVAQFSWRKMAEQTLDAYKRAVR